MKSALIGPALFYLLLSASCKHGKQPEAIQSESSSTAEVVLSQLISGNLSFKNEIGAHTYNHSRLYTYMDQVAASRNDQHPLAFILSCIDSRVPPEIIFDQGIGQLFVGRVAGNVEDPYMLGSMEYAVNVKHVKLIIVLGHTNCGAIHAAFGHVDSSNEDLVPLIGHVKEGIVATDTEPFDASARHNVAITVEHILKYSKVIRSMVEAHQLVIAGGLYDVAKGTVDWNMKGW
ncbi:MAG TPA: carbonic anhydrase [Ferruginibacter sp.]|nr:carbonic anhydrase [Ferruginibacter sp.]